MKERQPLLNPNLNNRGQMDLVSLKCKVEFSINKDTAPYISQYNDFWRWKISVERDNEGHILDADHIDNTRDRLLAILPSWQTYRGVKCNYEKELPIALGRIADAYNEIKQYSLLEFHQVPEDLLRFIWDTLGRVKEKDGVGRTDLNYFIIAVCKPLMFVWGQTLAFDSINRMNINKDWSLQCINHIELRNRWTYSYWKSVMQDFQRELLQQPNIIDYCGSHSNVAFGSNSIIPYGRYLDIYYYY
jgi:hypothetical protein